jgi:carbamoyltransferase
MSVIYGIYGANHGASIALVVDGKIISCIEEERLTRVKAGLDYQTEPKLSSEKIQEITGYKINEADHVVWVQPYPQELSDSYSDNYEVVGHHDAHAAGAYFMSNFQGKVLNISYDGGGDKHNLKVFLCENGKMTLVKQEEHSLHGSLSHLWGYSTLSVLPNFGWRMCKDEGKLMGMAADGYYDDTIYKMLKSVCDYKDLKFYPPATYSKVRYLVTMLREIGWLVDNHAREVFSYNIQKLTNDLMLEFLNDLHKLYPEYTQVCLSGGLFANVKLNQKINQLDWVDEVFIVPPMGDEGLAVGAAIHKANELGEIVKPFELDNVFFGISYTNDEVYELSKKYDFKRIKYNKSKIGKYINDGQIVGWFQDGFEHGPRALGARSILVRPTDVSTHRELNERLNRHDTMPFAPMVLADYFDEIFVETKSKYTAEFMTMCYDTKDEWIDKIPAVIQKSDNTARPQIVRKDKLPKVWDVISEYYKLSGIPVVLNTSFNAHNEPIINSPNEAFVHLESGVIDKLVIGDYVYNK